MSRTRLKACAVTLAFTLLFAPGLKIGRTQTPSFKMRYLLTATEGIVLERPEMLSASNVRAAQWSYDGTYALALREVSLPTEGEQKPLSAVSLSVWYSSSRRMRTLWTDKSFQYVRGNLFWLPHSGIALAEISGRDTEGHAIERLLWLDPSRERVREIAFSSRDALHVCPTAPFAIIHASAYSAPEDETENAAEQKAAFRILKVDGTVTTTEPLPEMKGYWYGEWTRDGKIFHAINTALENDPDRPGKQRLARHYLQLNQQTGAWTPVPEPTAKSEESTAVLSNSNAKNARPLRVERGRSTIQEGNEKQKVHPAWLITEAHTDKPRVLLTSNCEEVTLSPAGNAVLYRTQEGAFIVPLSRVPIATMVQTLRALAVTNAKHIGLGITQYVQDYDERYPLPEFDIVEVVGPYTLDDNIFEGFVYHFPGAELEKIEDPVGTILGTLPGPGGEAVLYADGHVKWRDRK